MLNLFMKPLIAGLLALLVTGCSLGRVARIQQNRTTYETWSPDMRKAVSSGDILKGMSPAMVQMAWGKPDQSSTDPSGRFIYWVYRRSAMPAERMEAFSKQEGVARPPGPEEIVVTRAEPGSTTMVVFELGQVVRVEKGQKR